MPADKPPLGESQLALSPGGSRTAALPASSGSTAALPASGDSTVALPASVGDAAAFPAGSSRATTPALCSSVAARLCRVARARVPAAQHLRLLGRLRAGSHCECLPGPTVG